MTRRLLILLLLLLPLPAAAQNLVTDLSAHVIRVTTGFTGAHLIVFGSMDQDADVAIVVQGPMAQTTVRRKARPFGIWLNAETMGFTDVPGYYAVASSKPADQLASPYIISANGFSLPQLKFPIAYGEDPANTEMFRNAMLERLKARGLYREIPNGVHILGGRLFRTNFALPANVPIGSYIINVYLLRDGKVLTSETLSLSVDETGFGASVSHMARQRPFLYALISVLASVMMGGITAWLFHKLA